MYLQHPDPLIRLKTFIDSQMRRLLRIVMQNDNPGVDSSCMLEDIEVGEPEIMPVDLPGK